jgi:glycosyltransferase involved in cell wall biosynthesis
LRTDSAELRVVHVAHAWRGFEAGGVGRYATALVRAQIAAGASAIGLGPEDLGLAATGFRGSWEQPDRARGLAAHVQRHRANIVHVHHFDQTGFGLVAAAQAAGAKVVVTLHDHHVGCARGQRVDREGIACVGPSAARCAKCLRPDGRPGALGSGRAGARIAAAAALRPDLWLTVAPHLADTLGVRAEAVDLPVLASTVPTPERQGGPMRFLWVGALIPTKAPDLAIEAFRTLPAGAATLDLVGPEVKYDGSFGYPESLRRRLSPGITLHPASDTAPWYARSDALLFTSRWDEGCPLVLREAAASGLPILANNVPGARHALGAYPAVWLQPTVPSWARGLAASIAGLVRPPAARFPTVQEHAALLLRRYRSLLAESR